MTVWTMWRRRAGAVALALLLPFAGASAQEKGGTLKMVVFPEPPVLVSAANSSTFPGIVSTKIFEGLVTYDEHEAAAGAGDVLG